MNGDRAIAHFLTQRGSLFLAIGLAASAGLAFGAALDPAGALRGLLFAFLFWLAIPMGSAVLLDIHTLTGGAWGQALRPIFTRCARTVPLFGAVFVLLAIGARQLYPWASHREAAGWSGFSAGYLTVPGFALRGVVIFAMWWLIAAAGRPRHASRLWAGIALALYGVTITVAAVDWSMSLTPKWSSSSYAAMLAIGQITAAFGFAALVRLRAPADAGTSGTASFLIACVLGYAYLGFMQFLVIWAGNLPDKVSFYIARTHGGWPVVEWAALTVGVAGPFLMLIRRDARHDSRSVGIAGGLALVGLMLDWLWQIAPPFPLTRLWAFGLAPVALGGLWIGLAFRTHDGISSRQAHEHA